MENKIGLSLIENNRIRILLDSFNPVLFELRRGYEGALPYDDIFVGIKITDVEKKQKTIELATKYATTKFGVQSLFQIGQGVNAVQYESCEIDFTPEYVNKNIFLSEIVSLNPDYDLIEKIKSEKCTQIMISFPMDYPDGYLERKLEQLKNSIS